MNPVIDRRTRGAKPPTEFSPQFVKFNELPPESFVNTAVIQHLLGKSRSTIWRMVKEGYLPAPYHLSPNGITNAKNTNRGHRLVGFKVGEIRQLIGGGE